MGNLEKFDKNMLSDSSIQRDNTLMYPDCFAEPFRLSGFYWFKENGKLHRLPDEIAEQVSEATAYLHTQSAGATLSFRTNSKRLYLEATVLEAALSPKFAPCAKCGFDVYLRKDDFDKPVFRKVTLPDPGSKLITLDIPNIGNLLLEGTSDIVEVTINFPPYDEVTSLQVGLDKDCTILPPRPYAFPKPIVFYGSSITQGACACRPGNAYAHILCRRVNAEQINLGFSGSAKGEPLMAETIAKMDMQVFVMDYDHNAPTPEHLEATHENFYKIIRSAQPELPIIMVSKPGPLPLASTPRRKAIIRATYEKAVAAGDKKVWFVDGEALLGPDDRDACCVDGTHPNDLGFMRMADGIEPVLRQALGL